MFINYSVKIEDFAERHYLKNFSKKYKRAWDVTWQAVIEEFKRLDSLFQTSIAEKIVDSKDVMIVKSEFRVAGTKESRKSSGNRCIVAVKKDAKIICILLVYHKTDIGDKNETAKWKMMVRENYPEYKNLF
jgi:hypothetical protein